MSYFNTETWRNALSTIEKIEERKLSSFATRIAQSIVLKSEEQPFTEEELTKLVLSLSIARPDIDVAIEAILGMFKEAIFYNMAADVLESKLTASGLENEKSAALGGIWTMTSTRLTESVQSRSVLPQVEVISYDIVANAASDVVSAEKTVNAHLQLGLKSEAGNETLILDLSKGCVQKLQADMQRIQAQLDAIAEQQ